MTDFRALLTSLATAGVKFILVGGAAAVAHGSARLTQDLDVVYDRSPDNVRLLVAALAPHRPACRSSGTSGRCGPRTSRPSPSSR